MVKNSKVQKKQMFYTFSFGMTLLFFIFSLYIFQPTLVQYFELKIYDVLLTNQKSEQPSDIPVIVDIDDASLAQYGQWPWARYLMAILIQELTNKGAASIGLDILLSEPDRGSPSELQKAYKSFLDVNLGFTGLPEEYMDTDQLLARVMAQSPVVLGMYMRYVGEPDLNNLPQATGLIEQIPKGMLSPKANIRESQGVILPLKSFVDVAAVGAINVAPDMDGVVRKVPLIYKLDEKIYANVALRSLMLGLGVKTLVLQSGVGGLERIKLGKYSIPVTSDGYFNVYFRGPSRFYNYISAKDVLDGTVPLEAIQGKVVFVGTSAAGLLDIRAQPYDSVYPGVEIHAATVDSILSNKTIIRPSYTPATQVMTIFIVGIISIIVFGLFSAVIYLPFLGIMSVAISYGSYYLFSLGIFLSPFFAIITLFSLAITLLAVRYFLEEKQKRVLRQAFSRYVSPEIVTKISERGDSVFSGEERELSILFTDVRGFTSISEKLKPEQVVSLLNRYFTPMTSIVRNNQGTLDKFIGDAIMAFWNAPLDVLDHAKRSVESALAMQETLVVLNDSLVKEFGIKLVIGAGVHTGNVYVGNMGSQELLDYTCIGDSVNLASRLEGLCSKYGVGIIVSGETKKRYVGDLVFQKLDLIRVKGKKEAVDIYTVLHANQIDEAELGLAHQGQELYFNGDFMSAEPIFSQLKLKYPDKLLYEIYQSRCQTLIQDSPLEWNGVWVFETK